MKRSLLALLLLAATSLGGVRAERVVRVAAAANLRYAMSEIESLYESKFKGVDLQINYGASGTFFQQILNGAPFDLLLSADELYPQKLKEQGLTTGECHTYACGKLAIYGVRNNVDNLGIKILTESYIKRIAIANPRTAPYGSRSVDLLKALGLWSDIEHKIVYGDSISQAAQFAMTGNTDLGFVALSLLLNPEVELKGSYYIIPEDLYTPIAQAGVLIKQREPNESAAHLFEYILSDECSHVWDKYGYYQTK